MADFLSRLAGQALGMAPSIQPLGTPMYAPGRAPGGAAGEAWGHAPSDTAWAGEDRAEAEAPGALYPAATELASPAPSPRLLAPRPGEPWGAAPSAPPLRPAPPAPSTPSSPPTRLDADGPRADPASAPPLRELANWRAALVGQRPPASASALRAAPPEWGADEPDGTRVSAPSDGLAHPFGVAAPDGTMDAPPRASAWPARLMPRRAAPAMPPAVDPSMPPAASAAGAPAIQVTIGRIDVRAITPPAPAPRAAPARPTPALTLDEYLKRQNGGRR